MGEQKPTGPQAFRTPASFARRSALRIVLIYAVAAAAWIVISDMTSRWYTVDPDLLTEVAVVKGVAFVAVTSLLLFWQIQRDFESVRRANNQLRESEERYATLSEASPDMIFVIGPDERITYANAAAEQSHSLSDTPVGQPWTSLFDGKSSNDVGETVRRVFETGERASLEIETAQGDASRWMDTRFVPIKSEDGPVLAILGVSRDLTERKEAEESLMRTTQRLDAALKSVTETMGKVVEARDPYTRGHECGVARISKLIAEDMGLPPHEVEGIEVAALVHDIGKLAVPGEILTKPGRLTDIEFQLVKEHSRTGHDILAAIDFDWPVAEIVLQHHERADGSGYPNGLSGDEILPAARVLAAADVIEAMASHRPYRAALGLDAAIAEITTNRHKFDEDVVAACVRLYESGALEV